MTKHVTVKLSKRAKARRRSRRSQIPHQFDFRRRRGTNRPDFSTWPATKRPWWSLGFLFFWWSEHLWVIWATTCTQRRKRQKMRRKRAPRNEQWPKERKHLSRGNRNFAKWPRGARFTNRLLMKRTQFFARNTTNNACKKKKQIFFFVFRFNLF